MLLPCRQIFPNTAAMHLAQRTLQKEVDFFSKFLVLRSLIYNVSRQLITPKINNTDFKPDVIPNSRFCQILPLTRNLTYFFERPCHIIRPVFRQFLFREAFLNLRHVGWFGISVQCLKMKIE